MKSFVWRPDNIAKAPDTNDYKTDVLERFSVQDATILAIITKRTF